MAGTRLVLGPTEGRTRVPAVASTMRDYSKEAYFTALLIAAARSVFSQENPPSFSGARPKWP